MIQIEADILENDILDKYPSVLEILLKDRTTKKNIFWATDNYTELGAGYEFSSPILPELITGEKGCIIVPRVKKHIDLQLSRVKDMAEVFTPSWICNAQNNLIDNLWFGHENVFNTEVLNANGTKTWQVNDKKITFPKHKTWKDYISDTRLEMTCGEAPYITSRYDTTTGDFIPIEKRIGILDRKLRIINENTENIADWLESAQIAYKNTYAFEWQGDSLLLAREAMLITFIENFALKFSIDPSLEAIQNIADIISWNVWQMDGLKGVVPNSCKTITESISLLFHEPETKEIPCEGCAKGIIHKHNGIYSFIKDWSETDKKTGKEGKEIKFIDLIKNSRL